MSGRSLPVLNFGPLRKYPTKLAEQEFADDRQVCGSCLSGVCCSSEDPIYLTSFDILRLAAFFDLSPADFLLKFTQDRFDGEDSDLMRRSWIDDLDSSKVTYLRRRGNTPASPCVFLKYVREVDGTPRRICGVHDARPLSCREYYFSHCKTRQTGELAALQAEGYEKVRDREITEEMVDAQLARFAAHDFSSARAAASLEYSFWVEMKRVLNLEQANVEGGNSYDASAYQDPIGEKLNRVLSARHLRFEEDYGPEPHGEQLMPYTSGLSFARSAEYGRITGLLREPPSSGLYAPADYPLGFALRTMVPGVRHSEVFQTIPEVEIEAFLDGVSPAPLFPAHGAPEVRALTSRDVYASVLKGLNHLIRFAGYLVAMGNVLEDEPPGVLELELLSMISDLETSPDPFVAHNPHLEPLKLHVAALGVGLLEERSASARKPAEVFAVHRRLCSVSSAAAALPADSRGRFEELERSVRRRLRLDRPQDYVDLRNPVSARCAAGHRLNARGAWATWERTALDVGHATRAGFDGLEPAAYYRRSVEELEEIPFRESYATSLYRVVVALARGMRVGGSNSSEAAPDGEAARRLASYGSRLFGWWAGRRGLENLEVETLAGFASCVFDGPGGDGAGDGNFGLVVHRLLDCQSADGSWGAVLTGADAEVSQQEYLRRLYQPTWACVDGLRPRRRRAPAIAGD